MSSNPKKVETNIRSKNTRRFLELLCQLSQSGVYCTVTFRIQDGVMGDQHDIQMKVRGSDTWTDQKISEILEDISSRSQ